MDSVGKKVANQCSAYTVYRIKRDAPHQVSEKNEWNVRSLGTTKKL